MFNKILIANRGEIACRIIKTTRRLGIQSVAIYSSVDRHALHVQHADEAFYVGDAPAPSSYLNIEAIIACALQANAEAIHPGYGFLSENPQFAQACQQAGLIFIGPSISAMNAMASKQVAKQQLSGSRVPLTPGYHGNEQSDDVLFAEAKKIGFPVLIKPANGGGGKGMRAVYHEEDILPAIQAARRESLASFADDTLLLEKLLLNPRHIEIQIMADNHGHTVHLFERDCSIQRRHQKIIEEAPAPHLSAPLRQSLAQAAITVAQTIDYRGAGTVEFLVDAHEQFYFMEMNTRLQVEHPVTEMITGLDLVEWQLRIAANESLPLTQNDIQYQGHAIECRVYAEDPSHDFLPSMGTIHFLHEPDTNGLRIDTGISVSSQITAYYDPMLSKIIAWGASRIQALQRMQQALRYYYIGGVTTNLPFLKAILQHSSFTQATYGTDFLTQNTIHIPQEAPYLVGLFSSSFYFIQQQPSDPLGIATFAWQMFSPRYWNISVQYQGEPLQTTLHPLGIDRFILKTPHHEHQVHVQCQKQPSGVTQLWIDDGRQRFSVYVEQKQQHINFYSSVACFSTRLNNYPLTVPQTLLQAGHLTAPMPATVVAVLKDKGDYIKAGERIMILEAMKMEHTIRAPIDGQLTDIFYKTGDQVTEGVELVTLKG